MKRLVAVMGVLVVIVLTFSTVFAEGAGAPAPAAAKHVAKPAKKKKKKPHVTKSDAAISGPQEAAGNFEAKPASAAPTRKEPAAEEKGTATTAAPKSKPASAGTTAVPQQAKKTEDVKNPPKADTQSDRAKRLEDRVDRRQENQEKRIQHGIKRGYLTPEETARLRKVESDIADMEKSFESDGKLSKDEAKQLKDALDKASAEIWAEKHDTEGKQMAAYHLGRNVFAKDSLTSVLENPDLTAAEARAFLAEFRHALSVKRRLANDDLTDAERAELQNEYDDFLNKYFEVRDTAAKKRGGQT